MNYPFKKCFSNLFKNKGGIIVKDIRDSTITVIKDSKVVNREDFDITEEWAKQLLDTSYDDEIKSKYIPELHQSTDFERIQLNSILNFENWKGIQSNQLRICRDYLLEFKKSYKEFCQVLEIESINIKDPNNQFVEKPKALFENVESLTKITISIKDIFDKKGYDLLNEIDRLICIPHEISASLSINRQDWSEFLDKEPSEYFTLELLSRRYNEVYYNLEEANRMLSSLKSVLSHKIIAGNAGTGKTHISAHLINSIKKNKDYVIFFKPKLFNGDDINFEAKLLQLLRVPVGYTLIEILRKLDLYAKANGKRCFIIIDALNETTKSSIGFSKIWSTHLQNFINQVELYSHLCFICTIRTSYVKSIWPIRPSSISEIKEIQNKDLWDMCDKYFTYYKIKPLNLNMADLRYFRTPLLLDLFCKFVNEKREVEKQITLDINTYLQVFEDYINLLVLEVKQKLSLQKSRPILNGLSESSSKYLANNEAIISVDEFSDAFDKEDTVTEDNSIARSILEGYLVFIKDIVGRNNEIVKHTQQEVGGYLLAKELSVRHPFIDDLLNCQEFKEKVIGNDPSKHHQLRLDILKFLIALRPQIIEHLKDKDGLQLSWWYLYNGFKFEPETNIPASLLEKENSKLVISEILSVSSKLWFRANNNFNFNFISQLLNKLDLWDFEVGWSFFIYNEIDFFYEFVKENTNGIKKDEEPDHEYYFLVAKFISYITATNIRELRDLATIYLIEFGKRYPISLLEIAEYSAKLVDSYIYERTASCCYGVALNLQNNEKYVNIDLPIIARRLFNMQFAKNPIAPVYNYIVIDSIKHLLDLAVFKSKTDLNAEEIDRFTNYDFTPPYDWISPTVEQSELISQSSEMDWPEPIGMDFGIYTIPRLMIERYVDNRKAISNVYKRIFELGYRIMEREDFTDERFQEFYWGSSIRGYEGKVDRVGKKYSWKGFFDYAGFLLLNKQLNVFEKNDTDKEHYERLGDVDIDICLPYQDYKLDMRLYKENLLAQRDLNSEWYKASHIDTIIPLFEFEITKENYIMLHGKIDQKLNDDYEIRSFLLAETFFIKKDLQIEKLRQSIATKNFEWDRDVSFSADRLRHVYFGELYWGNNFYESDFENISIPTGDIIKRKHKIVFQDTIAFDEYNYEDIGKEVEETYPELLTFESEPTLSEYLWESNSKILNGYSEYFPSIKMGKYLGLKTDPSSGKILDTNLNECFICIDHEGEDHFSNTFNFMRRDLLKRYMAENNLLLVYQVKQHSYDTNRDHNRGMKFYIIE